MCIKIQIKMWYNRDCCLWLHLYKKKSFRHKLENISQQRMNQLGSRNVQKLRSAIKIYWENTIDLERMYFHNFVDEWSWVRECLLCNLKEVFRVERKYWFNMILVTEQLWYVWKFHLYSSWKTLKISFSLSFFRYAFSRLVIHIVTMPT